MKTSGAEAASAGASAFGAQLREAFGQPLEAPVPESARSVEAGLAAFGAKRRIAAAAILLARFGRFLSNRIFDCRVAGTPRVWHLVLGAAGATRQPGSSPWARARLGLVPALSMGDFGATADVTIAGHTDTNFTACVRADSENGYDDANEGFTADDKFRLAAADVLTPTQSDGVLAPIGGFEGDRDVGAFRSLL